MAVGGDRGVAPVEAEVVGCVIGRAFGLSTVIRHFDVETLIAVRSSSQPLPSVVLGRLAVPKKLAI